MTISHRALAITVLLALTLSPSLAKAAPPSDHALLMSIEQQSKVLRQTMADLNHDMVSLEATEHELIDQLRSGNHKDTADLESHLKRIELALKIATELEFLLSETIGAPLPVGSLQLVAGKPTKEDAAIEKQKVINEAYLEELHRMEREMAELAAKSEALAAADLARLEELTEKMRKAREAVDDSVKKEHKR